jgi:hypothetical protein
LLNGDRVPADWNFGPERDVLIDHLIDCLEAGAPIDLRAARSAEAAAHDGQAPDVGGYLLGLCWDRYVTGQLGSWDEFLACGALAALLAEGGGEVRRAVFDALPM